MINLIVLATTAYMLYSHWSTIHSLLFPSSAGGAGDTEAPSAPSASLPDMEDFIFQEN